MTCPLVDAYFKLNTVLLCVTMLHDFCTFRECMTVLEPVGLDIFAR